jgi:hypothetical protein
MIGCSGKSGSAWKTVLGLRCAVLEEPGRSFIDRPNGVFALARDLAIGCHDSPLRKEFTDPHKVTGIHRFCIAEEQVLDRGTSVRAVGCAAR